MIKVFLHGRTGNQMFQLAFASILAQKNKPLIVVKTNSHFGYCLDMFDLPLIGNKLPQSVFLLMHKILFLFSPTRKAIESKSCFDKNVFREIYGNVEIDGYFQDGVSYVPYKRMLQNLFRVKEEHTKKFQHKYGHLLQQRNVVLNVRLGNYKKAYFKEIESSGLLPNDWYLSVLEKIDFADYDNLIVTSDDVAEVKQTFPLDKYNPIFIDDDVVTDYLFLLNSDCLIIANSSFSWWAAFLNDKKNKKVYSPKDWVGYNVGVEYPKGIMINDFTWV